MRIKRAVAKVKIKVRKDQIARERKKLRQIALARNKALKEGYRAADLAREKEDLRQVQLRTMKSKGIKPKKSDVEARTASGTRSGKGIIKALRATQEFVQKHSK